jgi:hypothetical protein
MSRTGESNYRGDAFLAVRGASRLRGSAAERLVIVFQCYLDDSGTSGLPIITLGGFFAHMNQWEKVEPLLDAVMNDHGVDIFHAKQFHDTDPPFKGWQTVRKLSFAEKVFSASHGALAGIAIGVEKEGLKQGKKNQPGAFDRMSPIGVAFACIMTRILTHPSVDVAVKLHGVSFLVETGPNNSEIEGYFHRIAKMPVFEGVLRSITFVPKAHSRAIQIADFLVFYAPRQLRDQFRFKGKLELPPCPFLKTMRNHGPIYTDVAAGAPKSTGAIMGKDIKNLSDLAALTKRRFP